MSKFLYFQDFHISGRNSKFYISNYFEDSLLLLDEILSIAEKENVQGILDGGDLLDTAEPSYRILDEIVDRVEKTKIPIYSLFGNHSQLYHSNEHSRYTGLAHIQKRSKYFKYLNRISEVNFIIQGFDYNHNVEEQIEQDGISIGGELEACKNKTKSPWRIAIVHAFVCPKLFPYASHVVCDSIITDADLVLVAHYHAEWEKKVANTLFKDIGCLGRMSITERDIKPKVLLIDTEKREIKEILLKSAKKAEEIFDLSKIEEIKEIDTNMDNFIKTLESTKFQGVDLKERVKSAGKELEFHKEPVDYLLEKIDKES